MDYRGDSFEQPFQQLWIVDAQVSRTPSTSLGQWSGAVIDLYLEVDLDPPLNPPIPTRSITPTQSVTISIAPRCTYRLILIIVEQSFGLQPNPSQELLSVLVNIVQM